MNFDGDFLKGIFTSKIMVSLVTNGALATFGAMANYLYATVKKDKTFEFASFVITAFLGFFIGNVVGNFLPADFPFRDGTLLVAGFVCYPLLGLLETQFPAIFLRRVEMAMGVPPGTGAAGSTAANPPPVVDPNNPFSNTPTAPTTTASNPFNTGTN